MRRLIIIAFLMAGCTALGRIVREIDNAYRDVAFISESMQRPRPGAVLQVKCVDVDGGSRDMAHIP